MSVRRLGYLPDESTVSLILEETEAVSPKMLYAEFQDH
jgi:hypothetical protein